MQHVTYNYLCITNGLFGMPTWGCSSVVERLVRNQKVASSSLVSSICFASMAFRLSFQKFFLFGNRA